MDTTLTHDINSIIKNNFNYFDNYPNVCGLALGYKTVDSIQTEDLSIHVLVEKKVPKSKLLNKELIPKSHEGITTDIIEIGTISAQALNYRFRPVLQGYSIGPDGLSFVGSCGAMVKSGYGLNTRYYILSSNHILANCNSLPVGYNILSPSIIDNGVLFYDTIAKLSKFIPIKFETPTSVPYNVVDCAIAEITDINQVSNQIALIGFVNGTTDPVINSEVKKSGRSSTLTNGKITSINATVRVSYPNNTALFVSQIITTPLSSPGDSGSLVVDNQNRAVGLLCSGSDKSSILNPISAVLSALDVSFV